MSDHNIPVGVCQAMCPFKELKFREKNKLLHPFEILTGSESDPKADPKKVVKSFSRSAAGKMKSSLEDLRPSEILLKTINYLIDEIMIKDVSWVEIYDFINDRIQAIRQDLVIQIIEDKNAVLIYEKCARFYVLAFYILCEESVVNYDSHLNLQQLSICLEKLMELYHKFQSDSIVEMISIYMSNNINNNEIFLRSMKVFQNYAHDEDFMLILKTCNSFVENNFIKFFLLINKLPLIIQLSFFKQFNTIRTNAFEAMNVAYSFISCKFPINILSKWLCCSESDVKNLCILFKIKFEGNVIYFNKRQFDRVKINFKKEYFIENVLKDVMLSYVVHGKI